MSNKKMNEDDIPTQESNSDESEDEGDKIIHLEDRSGSYKQSASIHDKYKGRPKNPDGSEWNIILAQFATCYQQTSLSKLPKGLVWDGEMSDKQGLTIKNYIDDKTLPKYIKVTLSNKRDIFMHLRMYPKILKMHASRKKDGYEEAIVRKYETMLPGRRSTRKGSKFLL